jgi:hypothetical protein
MWVHKACGKPIDSELRYSDTKKDYYFPVCPTCQCDVEMKDIEFIKEEEPHE